MTMLETWRDIPGYTGLYQISKKSQIRPLLGLFENAIDKEIINSMSIKIKQITVYDTKKVRLYKNGSYIDHYVQELFAMAYTNPSKERLNEFLKRTIRETPLIKSGKSSSYTGVHWHKRMKKWVASISVNGKSIHLGCFEYELEASEAYKKAKL